MAMENDLSERISKNHTNVIIILLSKVSSIKLTTIYEKDIRFITNNLF